MTQLRRSPGVSQSCPVLAFGLVLPRRRREMLLAFAQAPTRSQRQQQLLVGPAVEWRDRDPLRQRRECGVAARRKRLHPLLEHHRMYRPKAPALRKLPSREGRAARQVQAFEEGAAFAELRQALQPVGRLRRDAVVQRLRQFGHVDARVGKAERHRVAVRHDARAIRIVQHTAQLAEAPAQFTARVGRQVPQQFAQVAARGRARRRGQVSEEGAHLARGGQGQGSTTSAQREGAEQSQDQPARRRRVGLRRCLSVRLLRSHVHFHAGFHGGFHTRVREWCQRSHGAMAGCRDRCPCPQGHAITHPSSSTGATLIMTTPADFAALKTRRKAARASRDYAATGNPLQIADVITRC